MGYILPDLNIDSMQAVICSCLLENSFPGYKKYVGLFTHLTEKNIYKLRCRISNEDTIILQDKDHESYIRNLFPENKIIVYDNPEIRIISFDNLAKEHFDKLQKLSKPELVDKICTTCGTSPIIDSRYTVFRHTKYQII